MEARAPTGMGKRGHLSRSPAVADIADRAPRVLFTEFKVVPVTGKDQKCLAVVQKAARTAYDLRYSCRTEPPKMSRLE